MTSFFNIDPPPDFSGFDPHESVILHRRHLPHWRQEGASYFVTFRLADSLPQIKIEELKHMTQQKRRELDIQQTEGTLSEGENQGALARFSFEKTEQLLDQGLGDCVLCDNDSRTILVDTLHMAKGQQYELGSYVIMPNHVHLILRPSPGFELSKILQTQKRISSFKINKSIEKQGTLWQSESYDRMIRNAGHLWRCLQYIGKNPRKAKLRKNEFTRWVNPNWKAIGWDFCDE